MERQEITFLIRIHAVTFSGHPPTIHPWQLSGTNACWGFSLALLMFSGITLDECVSVQCPLARSPFRVRQSTWTLAYVLPQLPPPPSTANSALHLLACLSVCRFGPSAKNRQIVVRSDPSTKAKINSRLCKHLLFGF